MSGVHLNGRPPKPGPRYDCGRLRPDPNPRGEAIWYRLRAEGERFGLSALHRSQLAKLGWLGTLTDRQTEAGFQVGLIYHSYRYLHAVTRDKTASPSFERSAPGEQELSEEALVRLKRRAKRAAKQWRRVQKCFAILPTPEQVARCRELVETLCVQDRPLPSAVLPEVAAMLEYIAEVLRIPGPPDRSVVIPVSAMRPSRRQRPKPYDAERAAWVDSLRALRPDLDEHAVAIEWRRHLARIERAKYRRAKARTMPVV